LNFAVRISVFLIVAAPVLAQVTTASQPAPAVLQLTVTDENGVPVPAARVTLQAPGLSFHCETDVLGKCEFPAPSSRPLQLRIEKEGFYVFSLPEAQSAGGLEVSLTRQQEVRETVNVVESSPAIDPTRVAAQERLSGLDIINIPYPNTRDYRYVLNFIPEVVLDQSAQPHLAGSEAYQTLVLLDGFNVTQPASGQLLVRPSTDALRTVQVETSRIPAEYGKGAAGVLALETGIGDDHYRFAATNFLPSFQNKKGWTLDKVDPRFTVSGPIRKGRMWFFDALDGEYDNVIIPDLPVGEDTNTIWRAGNLAKIQANPTSRDILTASFLFNQLHNEHLNFSTLSPATATPRDFESAYVVSMKEQHTFAGEKLLELGFGFDQYDLEQDPAGGAPYVLTPEGTLGNYYLHADTLARRWQGLTNFYFPQQWHGRHDFSLGFDFDRIAYNQIFQRSPISAIREGQSIPPGTNCRSGTPSPCSLYTVFGNIPGSPTYNTETSMYLQDRWAVFPRLLIEPGVRLDWDQVVRRPLLAPRLAGTYVLDGAGNTKISAGVGVIYASTNLALIALPSAGSRQDYFFDSSGFLASTVATTFTVNRNQLAAPRFLNWSLALERKLPAQIFMKAEFTRRSGIHDFVYNAASVPAAINFFLQNTRNDRYYSFKVNLRRIFFKRYIVTASYTRSSSWSDQVLDYSLDNLVLSPQVPGPFPWDTPNRFISWGWLPLVKGFDAGYSVEARSGFPFAAINSQQQIVSSPGSYRFPMYFALNFHLEKRFHALGFYWALRGGFDNLTNRHNSYTVNNDADSPQFLRFSNFDRRAFTARIRFLGRK
jgi:hypothetical protein